MVKKKQLLKLSLQEKFVNLVLPYPIIWPNKIRDTSLFHKHTFFIFHINSTINQQPGHFMYFHVLYLSMAYWVSFNPIGDSTIHSMYFNILTEKFVSGLNGCSCLHRSQLEYFGLDGSFHVLSRVVLVDGLLSEFPSIWRLYHTFNVLQYTNREDCFRWEWLQLPSLITIAMSLM